MMTRMTTPPVAIPTIIGSFSVDGYITVLLLLALNPVADMVEEITVRF